MRRARNGPRSGLVFGLLLAAALVAGQREVRGETTEYELKAVFLFNFAKFVDWPPAAFADNRSPLRMCIFGTDPFGTTLDDLVRGEEFGGRRLEVLRVERDDDLRRCHVLFIGSSERGRLAAVLDGVKKASVLTVGESKEFLAAGGIVRFVLDGGRLGFDIDAAAAERVHLAISSKLLRLARSTGAGN